MTTGEADGRCATVRPAQGEHLQPITRLLQAAGLPTDGVAEWLPHFLVAQDQGDRVVAAAGLEVYGGSALLRSVVVRPDWRHCGLGRRMVERLLAEARELGTNDVYLLTTTAEAYFPRLGFSCIKRDDVPAAVRGSVEFVSACPASAVVMQKQLAPGAGAR